MFLGICSRSVPLYVITHILPIDALKHDMPVAGSGARTVLFCRTLDIVAQRATHKCIPPVRAYLFTSCLKPATNSVTSSMYQQ